jgi:hypothetical protein
MKNTTKIIIGVTASLAVIGAAFYYFSTKNKAKAEDKNFCFANQAQAATSKRASNSGAISKGGFQCKDGNRPCAWQKNANGNYACPCDLIKT